MYTYIFIKYNYIKKERKQKIYITKNIFQIYRCLFINSDFYGTVNMKTG